MAQTSPIEPPRRYARILLGIATLCLAGCAGNGAIEGHVLLPADPTSRIVPQPKIPPSEGGTPARAKDAVIAAWPVAAAESKPANGHARVIQTHGKFKPRILVIEPGTTVEFENRDRVFHNVFSISPTNPFDVGNSAPGEQKKVRFEHAGIVQIYCELHPKEAGFIVVAPGGGYTQPRSDGAYFLEALRPGVYTVAACHPAFGDLTERVEVLSRKPVKVDFRY